MIGPLTTQRAGFRKPTRDYSNDDLKKRRKEPAPGVQAKCAYGSPLDRDCGHSATAILPSCQEETEVINAQHFLFFHEPYLATASHWSNANRSQKLKNFR